MQANKKLYWINAASYNKYYYADIAIGIWSFFGNPNVKPQICVCRAQA